MKNNEIICSYCGEKYKIDIENEDYFLWGLNPEPDSVRTYPADCPKCGWKDILIYDPIPKRQEKIKRELSKLKIAELEREIEVQRKIIEQCNIEIGDSEI